MTEARTSTSIERLPIVRGPDGYILPCETTFGEATAEYAASIPAGEVTSLGEFCEGVEMAEERHGDGDNEGQTWTEFNCGLRSGNGKIRLPFPTDMTGMHEICSTFAHTSAETGQPQPKELDLGEGLVLGAGGLGFLLGAVAVLRFYYDRKAAK